MDYWVFSEQGKKSVDSLNLMSPDVLTPTLENSNLCIDLFADFVLGAVTESLAHHPMQDALDTYSLSFYERNKILFA